MGSKIMIPSCQDTLTKFWKCFRNVQGVRETFKKFDADGDAQISRQEVIQGASSSGMKMSTDEVDTLFILGDKNGDGAIDFAEFAEIMIPSAPERIAKLKKCFRNRTEIEAAFRRFDTNKDGAISFQEMKNGLSSCAISFTEQEVEICFAVADKDGDGEVSLSEFVDLLSTSTSSGDGPMAKFLKYCIGQAFRIMDADQDGSISFAELSISLRAAGLYIIVELVQPIVFYSWTILHVQFQRRISCFASSKLLIPLCCEQELCGIQLATYVWSLLLIHNQY